MSTSTSLPPGPGRTEARNTEVHSSPRVKRVRSRRLHSGQLPVPWVRRNRVTGRSYSVLVASRNASRGHLHDKHNIQLTRHGALCTLHTTRISLDLILVLVAPCSVSFSHSQELARLTIPRLVKLHSTCSRHEAACRRSSFASTCFTCSKQPPLVSPCAPFHSHPSTPSLRQAVRSPLQAPSQGACSPHPASCTIE